MRRAAERFGAALTVTEMLDADFYLGRDPAAALRAEGTGIAHHVVQIAGCRPDTMAESARRAEAAGAAMIDINMGCPAKRVTGGFAGFGADARSRPRRRSHSRRRARRQSACHA